ncbi:MAG TPA: tyrosine-type recombinase/integrase [Terriglobales bacterium]|nr:tyrosine-type recombinase/integrase [Terriglobales bacterium]
MGKVVGSCKTEASGKPVPLEPSAAEDLWRWKQSTTFGKPTDWYLQPPAPRAAIAKRVGWHTFRHTFSTLLRANGEDVKVVQELLRHANGKITMDIYTQALSPAKRQAQSGVARMILPKTGAVNASEGR